ncbi:MAG: ATP-binding protein [Chloroflexota bacterium]
MDHNGKLHEQEIARLVQENIALKAKENYLRVINEFAVKISSLNTIDQIVWAIAKHVIARLDFVDCVIYLVDENENLLVQRAAHGPKNPIAFEILDPITIPLGKGIVGSVAETGEHELVIDTSNDERYIQDDAERLAELAVPIVFKGKVLGVIDSEHHQRGFFQQHHLDTLITLASLAAPRIAFIEASEEAIHKKNQELEHTVTRLKAVQKDLINAKNSAEHASEAKSTFIYRMSHELRTPLNAIIGYSELLIEELAEASRNDSMINDLNKVEFAGRHLLQLINNILDISKIEANEMYKEILRHRVQNIVDAVQIQVHPLAKVNGNKFVIENEMDPNMQIWTDEQKLKQILINLLGNAFKFTQKGVVKLLVNQTQIRDESFICFKVSDSGVGISPGFVKSLFDPFKQENNQINKRSVGTGLGLAISGQLAKLLDGKITVESKLGEGTTFTVLLPII